MLNINNLNKKNSLYNNFFGEEKGILELNLKDFIYKDKKLFINNPYFERNKGLIIFYSPFCKYCKKISDLLIKIALSHLNLFSIGSVNSENIEDGNDYVCSYANIQKFPTLKYISEEGIILDYPYDYNMDNLIYYINMNI